MAEGQVGRPPIGGIAKERSETAKRAYVAARLAQRSDRNFLDGLGVALSSSALSRAGAPLLWHPPDYNPRGRKTPDGLSAPQEEVTDVPAGALREWLAVDPEALDLGAAVVIFDFDSHRKQTTAYRDLGEVAGVVQLVALSRGGPDQKHRLLAVVLTDSEEDNRRLRDRLGHVDGEWLWHDIELQTVEPAVRTWRHLARVQAEREGLLKSALADTQTR